MKDGKRNHYAEAHRRAEMEELNRKLAEAEAGAASLRKALIICEEQFNKIRSDWSEPRGHISIGRNAIGKALTTDIGATTLARIERMEMALEAAHHSLTTLHGLLVFDSGKDIYEQALEDGVDHNGAWDAFNDATWQLDESGVLAQIEEALKKVQHG